VSLRSQRSVSQRLGEAHHLPDMSSKLPSRSRHSLSVGNSSTRDGRRKLFFGQLNERRVPGVLAGTCLGPSRRLAIYQKLVGSGC
jgi:hypothetical protein